MENNYKDYLNSFAWKAIKQVKLSQQPECECCGEQATTVHHLSYERRGSEREEDIVSICERCHHECHFVNGYQIKNDEDILKNRFEEVRAEYGGNNPFEYEILDHYKYKYEEHNGDIYINGIKSKILTNFSIELDRDSSNYFSIYYNGQGLFYVLDYSGNEKENNYETFKTISKILIFTKDYGESQHYKYNIIKLYKIESIKIFNIKMFETKEYIGIFDKIYYKGEILKGGDINTFRIIVKNCSLDKNHVYFYSCILEGADPESFKSLNERYFKDKNHIYYNSNIIEGADPDTFIILKNNHDNNGYIYYSKDKNYVFYDGKIIKGADSKTFEIIDGSYLKDKNNIYNYKGEIIEGLDSQSFKIIDKKFYADKDNVYYDGKKLEGVYSDGFEIIIPGVYYKDRNNVFYKGKIIKGADSKSFVNLNNDYDSIEYNNKQVIHNYSKDKNHIYYNGKVIDLLDPKTFEIIVEGIYHKDRNNVFYRGEIIEGADSKSFIKLNDNYFKDKNFVYYNSEKVKHDGFFYTTYADPNTFKVTGIYSGEDIKYKYSGSEKFKY